jgi:hypothetical protein
VISDLLFVLPVSSFCRAPVANAPGCTAAIGLLYYASSISVAVKVFRLYTFLRTFQYFSFKFFMFSCFNMSYTKFSYL